MEEFACDLRLNPGKSEGPKIICRWITRTTDHPDCNSFSPVKGMFPLW